MIRLEFEMLDAPGVRDPVLARTWARFSLRAGSGSTESCLTRVEHRNQQVHDGVYISLFPLVRWLIENWWFILHEPLKSEEYPSGRLQLSPGLAAWVRRHNLLAAREGMPLPDLTIYRDHNETVVVAIPDPPSVFQDYPVRFTGQAEVRGPKDEFEGVLRRFIEAVLARLDGVHSSEAGQVRENWSVILSSNNVDTYLARCGAIMGRDWYDGADMSEELANLLEGGLSQWQDGLRTDLLEVAHPMGLERDVNWVERSSQELDIPFHANGSRASVVRTSHGAFGRAFEDGYKRASEFRTQHGLPERPPGDLDRLLVERLKWPDTARVPIPRNHHSRVSALVGKNKSGEPRLATAGGSAETQRFAIARALYLLETDGTESPRFTRLVTGGFDWQQRASRAFAAELLAPASELRSHVESGFDEDTVDELASRLQVSSWVIRHQLRNHAIIDEFI